MEKTLDKSQSLEYIQFFNEIEQKEQTEDKLRHCLDFMRQALSKGQTPAFRDFWEAKKLCLDFFKGKISPRIRTVFWNEYVELSDEIRRLKEILDEQSAFSQEQIDLAVQALEKDFQQFEDRLKEMQDIEVPKEAKSIEKSAAVYIQKQKQLDLFNTLAGRLNGMRKELILTQMRIRHKNRLLDRLSKLGDQVFPKRKELIQEISDLFIGNVEQFVEHHFNLDLPPFFALKDEIKALQGFAKILTLNTPAFSKTREILSSCWDQIKEKEKEHQEKKVTEREVIKVNFEQISSKINAFKEENSKGKIGFKEADEKLDAIFEEMKSLQLGREEVKTLKKLLALARKPFEEKEKEQKEKLREIQEAEQKRKAEAFHSFFGHLQEVLDQAEALSLDILVEKWEALVKEEKALLTIGMEKAMVQNRLDNIVDHIQEKKWQNQLQGNGEDLSASLHMLLDERHKAKRKLKTALEEHRKIVGGSNLSLEESMLYQDLISEEKMRLDAIEMMIEEIEEKLFDIEE